MVIWVLLDTAYGPMLHIVGSADMTDIISALPLVGLVCCAFLSIFKIFDFIHIIYGPVGPFCFVLFIFINI
jgi:hypothetical protein